MAKPLPQPAASRTFAPNRQQPNLFEASSLTVLVKQSPCNYRVLGSADFLA